MDIRRLDERSIVVEDLEPFLFELLQQVPACADPGTHNGACERLYSSPTGGAEPEFDEDWKEYVEPELRQYFQSAVDVVCEDMATAMVEEEDEEESRRFIIPIEHLESWIHALNQARLALGARNDVTEEDMEDIPSGGDARALALFQIHFYGYLQERFLRILEGDFDD